MNRILCVILVLIFGSCQNDKTNKGEKFTDNLTDLENEIIQVFSDVDSLLAIDNGRFWNNKLSGPIILIEPESRVFYSNENNATKDFKPIHSIFTDTLPSEVIIANTAIDWEGKRWSMVMLPLPKDETSRNNLIIHELFHRLQPSIGFDNLQEMDNSHLDTYNGRLLLKLELEALEEALKSGDHDTRLRHIENALMFRKRRQNSPAIRSAENSLELNEGLAEYTAIMLSRRNADEMKAHLIQDKSDFYSNPTFVRSFAYHTIPIYGYILSSIKPNWHLELYRDTDLSAYLIKAFGIDDPKDLSVDRIVEQFDYNYSQIEMEETQREKIRIERITKFKIKFTEKPTLELPFQNMKIAFDPRNITPIENLGMVYPNLSITDNWGILTVDNGALLASDWSKVTVSEPIMVSDSLVKGDGWQLKLNPEWIVKATDKEYKLVIK